MLESGAAGLRTTCQVRFLSLTHARALVAVVLVALAVGACSPGQPPSAAAGDPPQRIDPGQWSGVSPRFTGTSARFDFRYANPAETLYKAHLSTLPDFSWDVYFNFTSGSGSPMVQENPHGVWAVYDCGATLYWRLEAVNTAVVSAIQGPTTVDC